MSDIEARKILDQIANRFNTDKKYKDLFFSDYQFAKNELAEAGLSINHGVYTALKEGYKLLDDPSLRPNRTDHIKQRTKPRKFNMTLTNIIRNSILIGAATSVLAGLMIYTLLNRSSKH
jgi:hypothetical protein